MTNVPKAVELLALLYNSKDVEQVRAIFLALQQRLRRQPFEPWFAAEHLTAWGDLHAQIETAITRSDGVVLFYGVHGLGKYQENIERVLVSNEFWRRGLKYGRVLVHLDTKCRLPSWLQGWPSVNHDHISRTTDEIAQEIAHLFSAPEL